MLRIKPGLRLPEDEIELSAIRAQGAGGQNVNKVATAIHLRFDVNASSLPSALKERLLATRDRRISSDGCVVIKAQRHRTQEKNRADALDRLAELIRNASHVPKSRRATRPTKASQRRRMDRKNHRGRVKALRGKVQD